MATTEPTAGRCNRPAWIDEAERKDPERSKSGHCEQYPVDGAEACRMHLGTAERDGLLGAGEGNGNAITHGATALPENLYDHLNPDEQAWIDDMADLYIEAAPFGPEHPLSERVLRYCTMMFQEWRAAGEVESVGPSENRPVDISGGGGRIVHRDEEHHLSRRELALNAKVRQGLKSLGCLPGSDRGSPEGSGGETIAQIFAAAVEQASDDGDNDTVNDTDNAEAEYVESAEVEP